ncbi:hypothetical protein RNAN_0510 [Rheinheimera nanhaiensis E407-8]|uniref:Uncharacterized protein n=1 Tax=Rheinheimera nanhaiensis E407-8 TaxID=562729 RepID=I1DU14_9GAMM|nr:hypothetical protein RNAN_0510 [Rheinheimera nanhaiensis E407-8]
MLLVVKFSMVFFAQTGHKNITPAAHDERTSADVFLFTIMRELP